MYRTHELHRVRTGETGTEEWACPTCGRRLLLQWPPSYHKTIIERGDEGACHVGRSDDITAPPPDGTGTPVLGTTGTPPADWPQPHQQRWLRETGVDAMEAYSRAPLDPTGRP